VIGTRVFSSGDASRKNFKAELQKRMDLQWVAGEIKIRRDWAGPQFLFSFAHGTKISPVFEVKQMVNDLVNKDEPMTKP
jgi:hypothetical protein